jgi:hypothetical protein
MNQMYNKDIAGKHKTIIGHLTGGGGGGGGGQYDTPLWIHLQLLLSVD